jgi:predicted GIY-YIG superfamily endonuclease
MLDYIYIISNDQGYIKVGVSKHPEKRLKQLQTGNEHKLELIFTEEFNCSRKHILHIEKLLHKELKKLTTKMIGEWFKIDENKLTSIKNIITYHRIRYEDDINFFERKFR